MQLIDAHLPRHTNCLTLLYKCVKSCSLHWWHMTCLTHTTPGTDHHNNQLQFNISFTIDDLQYSCSTSLKPQKLISKVQQFRCIMFMWHIYLIMYVSTSTSCQQLFYHATMTMVAGNHQGCMLSLLSRRKSIQVAFSLQLLLCFL